jgi:hypothetical protein
VRVVLAIAVLFLTACGEVGGGALAGGRPSPTPVATSTPDVALRLMDRVRNMTGVVRKIDRIAAKQEKWGDVGAWNAITIPDMDPNGLVWVIAVVGDFSPSAGNAGWGYQCATFVYDSQERARSSTYSALSGCARYFTDSLVPPSAPVVCPPEPQGYAYDGHGPATKGPVKLTISRDDGWRQPTIAPGPFLYEVPAGGIEYYETYCRAEHITTTPTDPLAARMLLGLGSPKATGSPGQAQLWLKDLHALEAIGDGDAVRVVVEPRMGFEIASFDWASVKAQNNTYVRFDYVDRSGTPLIPFRIANGP